jgi:xanthine dehydrogenase FAD-binding subunit
VDLATVTSYRFARTRSDLALEPGERLLAGGTWLFSEAQLDTSGLLDLTTMDWPALEDLGDGLRIGATCTIAQLASLSPRADWSAQPLLFHCASALLSSFKIWNTATVGGNVCRSFAAGSMISFCAALDGVALVWRPDGTDYRVPVADLVTGNGTNSLAAGEVLRSIDVPGAALRSRVGFRKIALAPLGRSGAVVIGRIDADGHVSFTVTAATVRPTVLRYSQLPGATTLRRDIEQADGYFTDAFGTADWRRAVSGVLAEEIRQELTR